MFLPGDRPVAKRKPELQQSTISMDDQTGSFWNVQSLSSFHVVMEEVIEYLVVHPYLVAH